MENCTYPQKKSTLHNKYKSYVTRELSNYINQPNIDQLNIKYDKWAKGISYITNKRVKIGGKLHKELGRIFYITYRDKRIFYRNLDIQSIINEIIEHNKINSENRKIIEYNNKVDEAIKNINNIKSCFDYVEFDGKRYFVQNDGQTNETYIENNKKNNKYICDKCKKETDFDSHKNENIDELYYRWYQKKLVLSVIVVFLYLENVSV